MTERSATLFGYRLRPHQAAVLGYIGGRMAVSAVPGSGKTLTLALLAARLVAQGGLGLESDVLIVTMQNAAVANISNRIRRILQEQSLPPIGYQVCTLHKLASDILRQRYDLAGMDEQFVIIDEIETRRMMHNAAEAWIAEHRAWWGQFLPYGSESQRMGAAKAWRAETEKLGVEVSKLCKHLRLTPGAAARLIEAEEEPDGLLALGVGLYERYQRYLQTRGGLDFDDLIWRAVDALDADDSFLERLRERWPYILEDEAQDSSPLQEQILERLAGPDGNWVRVGDPNQSINSTFTAADPRYFRRFLQQRGVRALALPQSGRCGEPIIRLANHLAGWTVAEHPEHAIREMAFAPQDILPTDPGDPQANPPAEECHIHIPERPFPATDAEAARVAGWAASYIRRYPDRTVAILCPAGWQGAKVVEALQGIDPPVPFDDLLRSTPRMRNVAKVLAAAAGYLGEPTSYRLLAHLFGVLAEGGYLAKGLDKERVRDLRTALRSVSPPELLFPRGDGDLYALLPAQLELGVEDVTLLRQFAGLAGRWARAAALPIDQLVLTVAQDTFGSEEDLAVAHTLATSLRGTGEMYPNWRLPDFAGELSDVATNQRAITGLSLADVGYQTVRGRIVVTTMHKAKGLEWDAVYLTSVDNLEFPDTRDDAFRDEPYFLPGRAPAVEARKRLETLAGAGLGTPDEHDPVTQARLDYIAERLRLLYVGITRARYDLAITWSDANGRWRVRAPRAMEELRAFQQGQQRLEKAG